MIALSPILVAIKGFGALALGRVTGSKETLIATLCIVGFAGYLGWLKFVHDPRVARKVTQKIERKADAAVQKSVDAQRRVVIDGAALRVRQRYCADC